MPSLQLLSVNGQNCGTAWTSPTGKTYNLAPLTRAKDNPWHYATPGYAYYWNFCANLEGTPSEVNELLNPVTAIQIETPPTEWGPYYPLGLLDGYSLSEVENGVQLFYTTNNKFRPCRDGVGRTVSISVICDPASEGEVLSVTESSVCTYLISVRSKYACPVSAGGLKCCLYNTLDSAQKTLCTSDPICPNLTNFKFLGGWTVDSCDSCSFSKLNATLIKN